jgi:hypothetical protein
MMEALAYTSTLKMETAGSSNKFVHFYQTTQYHIPENRNFQSLL